MCLYGSTLLQVTGELGTAKGLYLDKPISGNDSALSPRLDGNPRVGWDIDAILWTIRATRGPMLKAKGVAHG